MDRHVAEFQGTAYDHSASEVSECPLVRNSRLRELMIATHTMIGRDEGPALQPCHDQDILTRTAAASYRV